MFPPIPVNTIRAARASYGKGNLYVRLGDQLNRVISNLNPNLLKLQSDGYSGTLLAVLTLIQYVEGLTDAELTEALHTRVDLRYALHLPTPGPRFGQRVLCSFRERVRQDQPHHLLFEELFKTLAPELSLDNQGQVNICAVIKSICMDTTRAMLVEAMFHAIEALSANHFTWLRQVALPHWYERYSHSLVMLNSGLSIGQKEFRMDEVRSDIQYLLKTVDQSSSQSIAEVPEIKTLKSMWDQLLRDRPGDQCTYCLNNLYERR